MFIDSNSNIPKYKQISAKILADIEEGILKTGDVLMSINEFSDEHEIARDTVEKAYKELREKGIIRSVKGKGYFVHSLDTTKQLRIFLHFNKLSTYKKKIYDSFLQTIGQSGNTDIFIHHDSVQLFENQINTSIGNYTHYVIIPPDLLDTSYTHSIINKIPNDKVLILDKWQEGLKASMAVFQNFEDDIFNALNEAKIWINKYRKLTLIFPKTKGYAKEVMVGFSKFCAQQDIEFDIISDIQENKVNAWKAFVVIEEEDLVSLIKIIKYKNLQIGKEIGILSYNDTPLKEVLVDGITVISTDFEAMGARAATMILKNNKEKVQNQFKLIVRNSL